MMPEAVELTTKILRQTTKHPITVRIAKNEQSPLIVKLVKQAGFLIDGIDWSDIEPYWLLAQCNDKPIGCMQVLPGKPIGHLEMLAIAPFLNHIERAQTVWRLLYTGATTLQRTGASMACGTIPFKLKAYKKLLKKRGCEVITSGNLLGIKL